MKKSSLTSEQVSRIIKGTAHKVGGYSYQYSADHLNGTWHEEMGHGLVDGFDFGLVSGFCK